MSYSYSELTSLESLKIKRADIASLNNAQQQELFLRQWVTLAFENHPGHDRTDHSRKGKFAEINTAYHCLSRPQIPVTTIHQYYENSLASETIPFDAFDGHTRQSIEKKYLELVTEFNNLENDAQKKQFAERHAEFLVVAATLLENRQAMITHHSHAYFQQQTNMTYLDGLRLQWRAMIIRFLGQEYLDDLQYRYALGTGDLYPILDQNKLWNPIKLLAATLSSATLFGMYSYKYLLTITIKNFYIQALLLAHYYNQAHIVQCLSALNQLLIYFSLLVLPFYIIPYFSIVICAVALISGCLELIACPTNRLIRPIWQYMQSASLLSKTLLSLGILTAVALCALPHMSGLLFANLLPYLTIGLRVYVAYAVIRFIWNMYRISPIIAIAEALILGTRLYLSWHSEHHLITSDPAAQDMHDFKLHTNKAAALYIANTYLEGRGHVMTNTALSFPLPTSKPSEAVKSACLTACPTARRSHAFFNTPLDAPSRDVLQHNQGYRSIIEHR